MTTTYGHRKDPVFVQSASVGGAMHSLRRDREDWPGLGTAYGITGSHISDYDDFFRNVLSRDTSIVELVRARPNPVVLDLMADPNTIMSLFREADVQNGFGIAVKYGPHRSVAIGASMTIGTFIGTVTGDLSRSKTWRDINSVLDGIRADLIMERAIAGLENLPMHMMFFTAALNNAWRMLKSDGGTMLIETPSKGNMASMGLSTDALVSWIDLLRRRGIDADVDTQIDYYLSCAIRLTRHPQSPKDIPLLPLN